MIIAIIIIATISTENNMVSTIIKTPKHSTTNTNSFINISYIII